MMQLQWVYGMGHPPLYLVLHCYLLWDYNYIRITFLTTCVNGALMGSSVTVSPKDGTLHINAGINVLRDSDGVFLSQTGVWQCRSWKTTMGTGCQNESD